MPSRRAAFSWLLAKEWHELLASRSWWVLLAAMGPLVGSSFISAVSLYGEASGVNGTSAGVGEAFSPLVGVWTPTFGACEIAAAFLLPFVAIRQVAGDRQTGALKVELQHPLPSLARVGAKALVLLAGWIIASLAPAIALVLWVSYGGTLYGPEIAIVALGHVLNAGLTVALGASTGAIAEHPSTAAILTLAVTVGTWIVNFAAAIHGGWWERAAAYTPTAMVAQFQHGLLQLDLVFIALVLTVAGLGVAAIWTELGLRASRRAARSLLVGALAVAAAGVCTLVHASWDLSENRMNSFGVAEEAALGRIRQPVRIEVHLAPEDPRRVDIERRALSKLRRAMPHVTVDYVSATSTGLFEQTSEHYGEVRYEVGDRVATTRATTPESVLEQIFTLSGVSPAGGEEPVFRGHPLAATARGADVVFYGLWPAIVGAAGWWTRRRA